MVIPALGTASRISDSRHKLTRKLGKPDFRWHPRLKDSANSKVDGRDIGVRKHAVLRAAMPGHDI